jgi:hypothetical protein
MKSNQHLKIFELRYRFALFFSLIIVLLSGFIAFLPPKPVAATALTTKTKLSKFSLTVVGNKVVTETGQTYTPEGISVYGGLEDPNYQANTPNVYAQITAAVKYWHANTVRLQVAESNLFTNITPGLDYNTNFLQALTQEVDYIHSLHAVAVINDQTEFTSRLPNPTDTTADFWDIIDQYFGNKDYVIFDLFNEPRLNTIDSTNDILSPDVMFSLFGMSGIKQRYMRYNQMSQQRIWSLWKNGGAVNGIEYVGMQSLVSQIRSDNVNNILWIEGPDQARELPGRRYMLSGTNLVYSIHHPNLNNPKSWNRIGALARTRPVIDGEWSQYESAWAECYDQAYTNAPLYINYLHQHNVGIIAWSLQANSLLQGDSRIKPSNQNDADDPRKASDLQNPDTLRPSYTCSNRFGQGVGQLLKNYFKTNSHKVV